VPQAIHLSTQGCRQIFMSQKGCLELKSLKTCFCHIQLGKVKVGLGLVGLGQVQNFPF